MELMSLFSGLLLLVCAMVPPSVMDAAVPGIEISSFCPTSNDTTVELSFDQENAVVVEQQSIPAESAESEPALAILDDLTSVSADQTDISDFPSLIPTPMPVADTDFASNAPTPGIPVINITPSPTAGPTMIATVRITRAPTELPSPFPSDLPSFTPNYAPSMAPSGLPSDEPSSNPSALPSRAPSDTPSLVPSLKPSSLPSDLPSGTPSASPSQLPSGTPTSVPSLQPSSMPTDEPSRTPTAVPSLIPSQSPTTAPSESPTAIATIVIILDSPATIDRPVNTTGSFEEQAVPKRDVPSDAPSNVPSDVPSDVPSYVPSDTPSYVPSDVPSDAPSYVPSDTPSYVPSDVPSDIPSDIPSNIPSDAPSTAQSDVPSDSPSLTPDVSASPTSIATVLINSVSPLSEDDTEGIEIVSNVLSDVPSRSPIRESTVVPSVASSLASQAIVVLNTTDRDSSTIIPSDMPSLTVSAVPSGLPSDFPSRNPSAASSDFPSQVPSTVPSTISSDTPSQTPSKKGNTLSSGIQTPTLDMPKSVSDVPSSVPINGLSRKEDSDIPSMTPLMEPADSVFLDAEHIAVFEEVCANDFLIEYLPWIQSADYKAITCSVISQKESSLRRQLQTAEHRAEVTYRTNGIDILVLVFGVVDLPEGVSFQSVVFQTFVTFRAEFQKDLMSASAFFKQPETPDQTAVSIQEGTTNTSGSKMSPTELWSAVAAALIAGAFFALSISFFVLSRREEDLSFREHPINAKDEASAPDHLSIRNHSEDEMLPPTPVGLYAMRPPPLDMEPSAEEAESEDVESTSGSKSEPSATMLNAYSPRGLPTLSPKPRLSSPRASADGGNRKENVCDVESQETISNNPTEDYVEGWRRLLFWGKRKRSTVTPPLQQQRDDGEPTQSAATSGLADWTQGSLETGFDHVLTDLDKLAKKKSAASTPKYDNTTTKSPLW